MSSVVSTSSSRLSIAILGVGGIGSTFAYYLARAGHHVTVVARPSSLRFQQLQRNQAVVLKTDERAEVCVTDQLDEQVSYDLVIVTMLAHQVYAVLPSLQRSKAECVHFMFNTFEADRLQGAMGEGRCSFGMPFVMATLDREGKLDATISASRKTLHDDQRWVSVFTGAGIPSVYEADMPLWLRCHVPMCIAMESLAFRAQQRGTGASWAEAMIVARGLHGGFAIVQGLGYRLYPSAKKLLNGAPDSALAGMLWFLSRNKTFRDLLATGVGECRALTDVLLAATSRTDSIAPAARQSVINMRPAS